MLKKAELIQSMGNDGLSVTMRRLKVSLEKLNRTISHAIMEILRRELQRNQSLF